MLQTDTQIKSDVPVCIWHYFAAQARYSAEKGMLATIYSQRSQENFYLNSFYFLHH